MIRKIRKRDGRTVVFDQEKIASAIAGAGRAVGCGDDLLSEELASVVTLFLEKAFPGTVPSVGDVQDIVERVLMETGHPDTARAFILHGERRKKKTESLKILDTEGSSAVDRDLEVDHSARGWITPWSKAKIFEDLVSAAGIPSETASEIAAVVEDRVVRSGFTRISSALLRELVDNELFTRGFGGRAFGAARLSIPADEVRRITESDAEGRTPRDASERVMQSISSQFSLRELYAPEEMEFHRRGDGCLEGLSLPSGYLEATLYPRLLPFPFSSPEIPPASIGSVARFMQRYVSGSVVVDLTETAMERACVTGESMSEFARGIVLSMARGPAGIPDGPGDPCLRFRRGLSLSGERIVSAAGIPANSNVKLLDEMLAGFVEAVGDLSHELAVPVLHVDLAGEAPPTDGLLARLVVLEAAGRVRLSAGRNRGEPLAAVEPLVSGILLDLESIRRGGGDRQEERFDRSLAAAVKTAAAAFASKKRFLQKLHRRGRGPKAGLRRFMGGDGDVVGPGTFRIVPLCLREAALKADQGSGAGAAFPNRFVVETLHRITRLAAAEERRYGLRIRVDPPWSLAQGSVSDWFEGSVLMGVEMSTACASFVDLDPVPDFFTGDAESRIKYIKAVLNAHPEPDHAS